jgi:phosphoglycolate phosphatase
MQKYRLLILDFDGTLCVTHEAMIYCMRQTFAAFDMPRPAEADIRRTIGMGIGLEETFASLNPILNSEPTPAMSSWIATYRRIYNSGEGQARTHLFPAVRSVLRKISDSGIAVVLLSNKGKVAVRAAMERFRIAEFISLAACDAPGIQKKPDPDTFVRVIRPAFPHIAPAETLVVGDTSADILFARNVVVDSCWASYGYGRAEECLPLKPTFTIERFTDLGTILSLE